MLVVLLTSLIIAACGTETTPTTAPSGSGAAAVSGKIALLLPEAKTTRYETADRPFFEAKMKQLCPNCEIIYNNANQDASLQLSQAEAALTNGADPFVLAGAFVALVEGFPKAPPPPSSFRLNTVQALDTGLAVLIKGLAAG